MGLSRSRTITLVVAVATLTSNVLSSVLFSQLPDDPYHLASNYGWYLHFANLLSIFGFLGALKQHALSIAIFANYLLLDTLLSAVPRFLLVSLLSPLSSTLCTPESTITTFHKSSLQQPASRITSLDIPDPTTGLSNWENLSAGWTPDACYKIVWLAQVTLGASVVAATVLQFVGALNVREYARRLWVREIREEEQMVEALERERTEGEWGFEALETIREEVGEKAN